ncbi:MAG: hypothetical protein JNL68_17415 [Burkholderiales bacterium]|nr:hypothetical protein [Burkholderiales bacterium]
MRESSYVLSLVHPHSAAAEKAVLELIASYKASPSSAIRG